MSNGPQTCEVPGCNRPGGRVLYAFAGLGRYVRLVMCVPCYDKRSDL